MEERERAVEYLDDLQHLDVVFHAFIVHGLREPGSDRQLAHCLLVGIHVVRHVSLWISFSDRVRLVLDHDPFGGTASTSGSSGNSLLHLTHILGLEGEDDGTGVVADGI